MSHHLQSTMHVYEVCPRKDHRDVDLISDAVSNAEPFRRSHDAVIRVYDVTGNVIATHEHTGDFRE